MKQDNEDGDYTRLRHSRRNPKRPFLLCKRDGNSCTPSGSPFQPYLCALCTSSRLSLLYLFSSDLYYRLMTPLDPHSQYPCVDQNRIFRVYGAMDTLVTLNVSLTTSLSYHRTLLILYPPSTRDLYISKEKVWPFIIPFCFNLFFFVSCKSPPEKCLVFFDCRSNEHNAITYGAGFM